MGQFAMDLDRFKIKTEEQLSKAVRKIALTAYRRIIMRTPVLTGRARGNWMCTVGAPAMSTPGLSEIGPFDKTPTGSGGGPTIATMSETVDGWKPIETHSIFLTNNLPYIKRLNDGYSKQAPARFVELAIAEVSGVAMDAAEGLL